MVLTVEEVMMAEASADHRIQSALRTRRTTVNFSEQCCSDREIQRYLRRHGTLAYKFNCCVVHQPWKFHGILALADHGWEANGPNIEELAAIWHSLPVHRTLLNVTNRIDRTNNLNKKDDFLIRNPLNNNGSNNNAIRDDDHRPVGCFWQFFSYLFG